MTDPKEDLADAIAIMTAWSSEPGGLDFARDVAAVIMEEREAQGGIARAAGVIGGFVTLAGWLLIRLEKRCGDSPQETLGNIARKGTQRDQ